MSKPTQEDVNLYLDDLRSSGLTNMFGAASYLRQEFDLGRTDAMEMLAEWMRTFSERHPKAEGK